MLLNHTSTLQDSKQILIMAKRAIFRDTLYPESSIPDIRELFKSDNNHYLPRLLEIKKGKFSKVIPGTYFHYANLNFVIIAHIIETIEQRPFHVIIRNRLLDRYSIPGGFIIQDIPKNAILSPQYQAKGTNWIPEADAFNEPYDSIFTSIKDYIPGRNVLRFSPQAGLRVSSRGLATFYSSFLSDTGMLSIRRKMFESTWKAKSDNNSHQFDNLFKEWGLACHIIKEQQEPFTTNLPWIGHIGRANGASTLMYCSPSTQRGIIIYINGMKKETNGNMGFAPVENEIIKVIVNRHWRK
jgi:CubicO group peptidase (beta-lactamase class C family)